jgi:hypothetical protein
MTHKLFSVRNQTLVLLAALILLGSIVPRIYYSSSRTSVWRDEAQDILITRASHNIGELRDNLLEEGAPPLHYMLEMLVTGIGGSGLPVLRGLSLFFGTLCVLLVMVLAWRAFDPVSGLLAGLFTAASPFFIYYSSEIRCYALFSVLALVQMFAYLHLVRRQSFLSAVLWGAAAALMAYVHYYAFYIIFSGGVFALLYKRSVKMLLRMIVAGVSFTAVFLPWLPSFLTQFGYDLQPWYAPRERFSDALLPLRLPLGTWGTVFAVIGLVGGILLLFKPAGSKYDIAREPVPEAKEAFSAFLAMSLGGCFLAWMVQMYTGPFLERYLIGMTVLAVPPVVFFWSCLLQGKIRGLPVKTQRVLAWVVLVAIVCTQWGDPFKWLRRVSAMEEVARRLEKHARPDDLIWVFPAQHGTSFLFHYQGPQQIIAAPYENPTGFISWVDLPAKEEDADIVSGLYRKLEDQIDRGGRVWYVGDYLLPYTPEWAFQSDKSPDWHNRARMLRSEYQIHRKALRILYGKGIDQIWWDWPAEAYHEPMTVILFEKRPEDEPLIPVRSLQTGSAPAGH